MPASSLNNFTVPLDTSDSKATQNLLMPKLQYRFRALFENFGISSGDTVQLTKQVASISRPNLNFNPFTIDVYNSKVNLVGKPTWEAVTVTLRDDIRGDVSKLVGEQVQKQFDFMQQSSASSGNDYKFLLRFEMLDGGNGEHGWNVLETWQLVGAFIATVNYNEMAYTESSPATITLSIMYDNAIQTDVNGGVGTGIGTDVGRTLGEITTGVGNFNAI